jgi:hypothetical protein
MYVLKGISNLAKLVSRPFKTKFELGLFVSSSPSLKIFDIESMSSKTYSKINKSIPNRK